MLLASTLSPLSAQRRVAIRVPAGEASKPAAPAPRQSEREREREREAALARARRLKGAAQDKRLTAASDEETVGVPTTGEVGVPKLTSDIMREQSYAPAILRAPRMMKEHELPSREFLPQDPDALPLASTPSTRTTLTRGVVGAAPSAADAPTSNAPQTVGTNFTGATLADTGAFPPDSMGAVGPTQFVVFVNGRLRTFNKATGAADGVVNADPDVFFSSVMTPVVSPVVLNFTSDPQVRYDRLTGRWFLNIIDVPCTNATCTITAPNRYLIAVSDAASAGVISGGTVWTFYFVQQNTVGGGDSGEFLDYPSLGVDNNALYVGGNMFDATTSNFNGTTVFVIRKSSVLSGGPVVTTAFRGLVPDPNTTDGMLTARGVDNYDPAATEGYFIGVSNAAFGRLIMRRIGTPGGTPTISADILITVSATSFPITVDHLGDTGGTNGNLDSLDDRLYAAHIRNGRLWTAHNMAVTAAGVASNSNTNRRNGVRWYELNVPPTTGTPTVVQSGTIFDSAATVAAARQYWIPTVGVSGQGHAAFGYSTAGTPFRIDAATNGRLRGDTLGTAQAVNIYTASSTAYNPPSDPGSTSGRRWGDYSFVSLDPQDDMTMWTIQEFCSSTNNYGVRVAKLAAPPPASPSSASPISVPPGSASTNVTITGLSVAGSEFYDPGANLAPPALPFNHISATVSGGVTVNSVTYTDPTHVTLNLNTTAAPNGPKNVTITNPDGQSATSTAVIFVGAAPPSPILISEFRLHGTAGGNDEFVELYNNADLPITVADTAGGTGYAVVGTNTTGAIATRFVIPNGTIIPARGHYLGVNNGAAGYSLGAAAAGDVTYATGIVDGGGVAVFTTTTAAGWGTNTRLDAVGFGGITGTTLFTKGTALLPVGGITTNNEYSFIRKLTSGIPQDTGDNQNDFFFISTTGATFSTRLSTLGAPSPENLASPINRFFTIPTLRLDPNLAETSAPNRVRDASSYTDLTTPSSVTGVAPATSPYVLGTLSIRRRFTNNTGAPVTKLRFRIVDITTFPVSGVGVADVRALSSSLISVTVNNAATCSPNPAPCSLPVQGTTLEQPLTQTMGGGLNSALVAGTVTPGTPLAPGASIDVQFLLGVAGSGSFRFFITIEALP
ncbi:MAG: lamin tail domain-containing protein [Pyrinomonadaceae bacterium]